MSVTEKNIPHIYYFTLVRIPGEKAHAIYVLRTCDSLSYYGCCVSLLPARRRHRLKIEKYESLKSFYNLKSHFSIKHLPSIDLFGAKVNLSIERLFFFIIFLSYFISSFLTLQILHRRENRNVILVSEPMLFLSYTLLKPLHHVPVLFEVHDEIKFGRLKSLYWKAFNEVNAVITTCEYLKKHLIKHGVSKEKITVIYHTVDISSYESITENKKVLREKLGLPEDPFIVLHCGHAYRWKKPSFAIDALKLIESRKVYLCFVGGTERSLIEYSKKQQFKNLLTVGFVSPAIVPFYLKAADALIILPGDWKAPLKLPEYMASQKPIIAPNNKVIREVIINEINGLLYDPDNPKSLDSCILKLIQNKDLAIRISKRAYEEVCSKYSYEIRARKMVEIIKSILKNILMIKSLC